MSVDTRILSQKAILSSRGKRADASHGLPISQIAFGTGVAVVGIGIVYIGTQQPPNPDTVAQIPTSTPTGAAEASGTPVVEGQRIAETQSTYNLPVKPLVTLDEYAKSNPYAVATIEYYKRATNYQKVQDPSKITGTEGNPIILSSNLFEFVDHNGKTVFTTAAIYDDPARYNLDILPQSLHLSVAAYRDSQTGDMKTAVLAGQEEILDVDGTGQLQMGIVFRDVHTKKEFYTILLKPLAPGATPADLQRQYQEFQQAIKVMNATPDRKQQINMVVAIWSKYLDMLLIDNPNTDQPPDVKIATNGVGENAASLHGDGLSDTDQQLFAQRVMQFLGFEPTKAEAGAISTPTRVIPTVVVPTPVILPSLTPTRPSPSPSPSLTPTRAPTALPSPITASIRLPTQAPDISGSGSYAAEIVSKFGVMPPNTALKARVNDSGDSVYSKAIWGAEVLGVHIGADNKPIIQWVFYKQDGSGPYFFKATVSEKNNGAVFGAGNVVPTPNGQVTASSLTRGQIWRISITEVDLNKIFANDATHISTINNAIILDPNKYSTGITPLPSR